MTSLINFPILVPCLALPFSSAIMTSGAKGTTNDIEIIFLMLTIGPEFPFAMPVRLISLIYWGKNEPEL